MSGIDYSKWDHIDEDGSSDTGSPPLPASSTSKKKGTIEVKKAAGASSAGEDTGAVVFLHGSGDTGRNLAMCLRYAGFEKVGGGGPAGASGRKNAAVM